MLITASGVDLFSRLGGGSEHWAKTLYVYLLISSILYKNTVYFGGNDLFARTIYYLVGNRPMPPRIDVPGNSRGETCNAQTHQCFIGHWKVKEAINGRAESMNVSYAPYVRSFPLQ